VVVKNIILFACAAGSLMACTMRADPEEAAPAGVAVPPPEVSIDLPLERAAPRDPDTPHACLLSTTKSCMELDSRKFEPCLADTADCMDKGEGGIIPLDTPVIDYPVPPAR
jgi:hypothetical protein